MAGQGTGPITTIPPFANQQVLPACATSCGPLYDANGACVPPAPNVPQGDANAYNSCFCSNGDVSPFSTAVSGVCDDVCDNAGLSSIATWFRGLCSVGSNGNGNGNNNGGGNGNGNGNGNGDGGDGSGGGSSSGSAEGVDDEGNGGDWISNHWQWVVMLAVLVVAIAGIWVGACIWRRRYLKKKDRQSTWGQKQSGSASRPSWGPGEHESQMAASNSSRPRVNSLPPVEDNRTPGSFMPSSNEAAASEKSSSKKRWFVKERT